MTCFVIEALGRIHKPCGQRSGFKKVLKGQNPGNSIPGKLKIQEIQTLGTSKSGKLKIWKTLNPGKLKIKLVEDYFLEMFLLLLLTPRTTS